MYSNIKVSIITVNYNNLEGLKRTVESVINQTYPFFEYIIIDGGSVDGSAAYILEMKNHFDYWISENDRGIYHAMNKGIDKSTGDYLFFLNSGDIFHDKNVLQHVIEHLNPVDDFMFYYGHLNIIDKKRNRNRIVVYPDKVSLRFLWNYSLPHQATFYKRHVFDLVGKFDERYKIISDWIKYIELLLVNSRYKQMDIIVADFINDGISSINVALNMQERDTYLKSKLSFVYDEMNELNQIQKKRKFRLFHSARNIFIRIKRFTNRK